MNLKLNSYLIKMTTKILLIDSRNNVQLNDVKSDFSTIIVDYETDTYNSLLNKIHSITSITSSITSIGYMYHDTFSFLKNEELGENFYMFLNSIKGL